jgi:hypothetical protein
MSDYDWVTAEHVRLTTELRARVAELEKAAAELEHDNKQRDDMLRAESDALAKGSDEWMRKVLGESYARLWGPDLEAFGRGVDELRARVAELEAELGNERANGPTAEEWRRTHARAEKAEASATRGWEQADSLHLSVKEMRERAEKAESEAAALRLALVLLAERTE